MILLAILAVGMLSLSSVALRTNSRDQAQANAQANARMALMLAIGELQQQLGADRRVNATSAILSDDEGKTTSATAGRRHWIGAYDSWDSTSADARPAPVFRRWLVSGSDSICTDQLAPTSVASSADVTFWTGVEADGSDRVTAPKQEIKSGALGGSFAWWVGDENSKALVSRLPEDMGTMARVYGDAQSAPTAAYHLATPLAKIDRKSAQAGLLVSHNTVELAAANPAAGDKTFHDFTTVSEGVLTDVARGGLKRDLSLFLDYPVSKAAAPKLPNTRRIYANGITWEELWLYHNAWRELTPPMAGLASTTGGNLANSQMLVTKGDTTPAGSLAAFRNDPFGMYKLPTYLRGQWLVSLWAEKKGIPVPPQEQEYNLYWVTSGILTLWNPSDVPIALDPRGYLNYTFELMPYTMQLLNSAGGSASKAEREVLPTDGHMMIVGTGQTTSGSPPTTDREPLVLMPGEVLILSEGPGNNTGPTNYSKTIAMKSGFNPTAGGQKKLVVLNDITKPFQASNQLRFKAYPNNNTHSGSGNLEYAVYMTYGYSTAPATNQDGARFLLGKSLNPATNPSVFPTITGDLPSIATMTGPNGKHPFFLFSYQAKSEDNPTAWSRMYNPRLGRSIIYQLNSKNLAMSGQELLVEGLSGARDSKMVQLSLNQSQRGIFGGSYWDHARGVDTLITHSIPREPPIALAAFQHAIANGRTERNSSGTIRNVASLNYVAPEAPHAIGNSYAIPVIWPEETSSKDPADPIYSNYTDHSYHVNRMLWDSWFLSSIVQRQALHHTTKKTARQVFADFLNDPSVPLPNRRMKPVRGVDTNALDELFATDGSANDYAHEIASSKLMVEGAFNVNSTSVEAWKALLASMNGAFIPVADGTNSPASAAPYSETTDVPVAALLTAYGSGTDKKTAGFDGTAIAAGNPAQWRGYRKLNASEIKELAEELVEEIRKRGPFLSMADFVNRRPSSDPNLALSGPLQAALDRTVNQKLFAAAGRVGTAPANVYAFPEAAELPKSAASPAHVRQADILTAIGSQLSVRSDTFRIRAYGETTDSNGKVLATAWCEAIVQRVPEYLDPVDPPEAADPLSPDPEPRTVPSVTSDTNRNLGRRIEIRSFRWLSKEEL